MCCFFFQIQKCHHRLSDQRQAVNQGQNPLPIYLALNVKDKVATKDFRGNVPILEKSYVFTWGDTAWECWK